MSPTGSTDATDAKATSPVGAMANTSMTNMFSNFFSDDANSGTNSFALACQPLPAGAQQMPEEVKQKQGPAGMRAPPREPPGLMKKNVTEEAAETKASLPLLCAPSSLYPSDGTERWPELRHEPTDFAMDTPSPCTLQNMQHEACVICTDRKQPSMQQQRTLDLCRSPMYLCRSMDGFPF